MPLTRCQHPGVDLDESKFTIAVPKGWLRGEGEAGTNRTVVAWHPPQETSTTVSVLNSLASVELTAITGLGSPYEFGFTVVYSQDRRARKKDRQIAELVDTQQRNGSYFIEYTIQRPEEGIFRRAPPLCVSWASC